MTNDTIIAIALIILSFGIIVLGVSVMSIMDGLKEWRRWLDGSPIKHDMSRVSIYNPQDEINRLRRRITDLEHELKEYGRAEEIAQREYRTPSAYIDDVLVDHWGRLINVGDILATSKAIMHTLNAHFHITPKTIQEVREEMES